VAKKVTPFGSNFAIVALNLLPTTLASFLCARQINSRFLAPLEMTRVGFVAMLGMTRAEFAPMLESQRCDAA